MLRCAPMRNAVLIGMGILAVGAVSVETGVMPTGQVQPARSANDMLASAEELLAPVPEGDDPTAFLHDEQRRADQADAKRAALADECVQALRRANRDQQWPTTLRCVRNDLQLDIAVLRESIAASTLVVHPLATAFTQAAEALRDALVAVVNGIDTGVYGTEAAVLDTRARLQERYRLPLTQATHNLHWSVLRRRLQATVHDLRSASGSTVDDAAAACWEQAAALVAHGDASDTPQHSRDAFAEAARKIRSCATETAPPAASGATAL